ncbi:MAG: aminodeoxychorismate synthase component I [Cyclobacteriaceae bacterium]
MMLNRSEAISKINLLAKAATPFVFFTDFLGNQVWIEEAKNISSKELKFDFSKEKTTPNPSPSFRFSKGPIKFNHFKKAFDFVVEEINFGNSFLVNLTFETPIETSLSLDEVYDRSKAKYKLKYKDQFVVFSPETFVKIEDGFIYSYPMKGTIDATETDAQEKLLSDPKEVAEHVTITDLIRNDLSQIAEKVEVTKFRFVSEVKTHEKTLLQVSSEIKGKLPHDYLSNLGTLFFQLLPAGSISGAPKAKTIEIIKEAESYDRGFYTGVCGHFDGKNLDSGVMIRFIEKTQNQLFYKSGGGITSFSKAQKEYQEYIDKVYIPI